METKTVQSVKRLKITPEYVYNLEVQGNHNYFVNGILTHNSKNIIIDESSLIDDIKHAAILRMLGDVSGDDDKPFLFEIGNPFRRNHFFDDSLEAVPISKRYFHIMVDYRKGLKEKRITRDQVNRMISKPGFDILYKCRFPGADTMDRQGYMPLLTHQEIYQSKFRSMQSKGRERLGIDIGEGGCSNVWVGRTENHARILAMDTESDLMKTADKSIKIIDTENIYKKNVFVDATGVGAGVVSRLHQKLYFVWDVMNGSSPEDKKVFMNKRAENYWRLRQWVREGGSLTDDPRWDELLTIRYRYTGSGKIQIMPKKDMIALGLKSPDAADGLANTFERHEPHDWSVDNITDTRRIGGYGGR